MVAFVLRFLLAHPGRLHPLSSSHRPALAVVKAAS